MKIVCVDPIVSKGRICTFSVFEDTKFLYQKILKKDSSEIEKFEKHKLICFDLFKTMEMFDNRFNFVYDVKTLYALMGEKFSTLIDLGVNILGQDRMENYLAISNRVNSHLNSYCVAKINVGNYTYGELLSEDLVFSLYKERAIIISDLFDKFDDKDILDFYEKTMILNIKVLHNISKDSLFVDVAKIKDNDTHFAKIIRNNTKNGQTNLSFNSVGARTGRLAFKKGTLNIYNMPKSMRKCIVAPKGFNIVQFDFNSFQPRLAIGSTDNEEFKSLFKDVDIYSIFGGDRKKKKIEFLAWLFSNIKNEEFERLAKPIVDLKSKVYLESKKKNKLINKFGRVINTVGLEKHVIFQNFITSLEVDVILSLVRMTSIAFKNRKSRVLFPYHDAVIMMIHDDDLNMIDKIRNFFENCHTSKFGISFPVKISIGKNFGELNGYDNQ